MIATLGFGFLFLSFLICIYALFAAAFGIRTRSLEFVESSRLAVMTTFPLITLSVLGLFVLLAARQYQFTFVYRMISQDLDPSMIFTTLWGGAAGSLLVFTWFCSGFAFFSFLKAKQKELTTFTPWVVIVVAAVMVFLLFDSLFLENPFERMWLMSNNQVVSAFLQPQNSFTIEPEAGLGIDPILRNFTIELFTPILLLGFAIFLIPFAYNIASLAGGFYKTDNFTIARSWVLAGWLLISVALVLEFMWNYQALGIGSLLTWSTLKTAIFLPWLTGLVFMHAAILNERENRYRHINYGLLTITFVLSILGVYYFKTNLYPNNLTASPRPPLAMFIIAGVSLAVEAALLIWRWKGLSRTGETQHFPSRESFFIAGNVFFIILFIFLSGGQIFQVSGLQVISSNNGTWYKVVVESLIAVLLALMGIAPLSSWGGKTFRPILKMIWKPLVLSLILLMLIINAGVKSPGGIFALWLVIFVLFLNIFDLVHLILVHRALSRNVNKSSAATRIMSLLLPIGARLVHIGLVLVVFGFIGSAFFQSQSSFSIPVGKEIEFNNFVIHFEGVHTDLLSEGKVSTTAVLDVKGPSGTNNALLPKVDFYPKSEKMIVVPGIWRTFEGDLYLILKDWQLENAENVTITAYYTPLILWACIGAALFLVGALLLLIARSGSAKRPPVLMQNGQPAA
jgi:cytochrome c-type biogenesis protein CcmF